MEWYFAIDGVTNGPFDAEAMKQLFREGKIGPKTSVWSAETGDWVQFNTTALQASAGPPPPPGPARPPMPPPAALESRQTSPADHQQPAPSPTLPSRVYDNGGLGRAVCIALGIGMFVSLISSGIIFKASGAQAKYDMAMLLESEAVVNTTLIIASVTAILFLIWLYRQTSNVWARKGRQSITPGWAIGWWFVPIMWFFKPLEAVLNVYDGVGAPQKDRWIVYLWWTLFWGSLVYVALSMGYLQQRIDTLDRAQSYAMWSAIYYAIDAGTAYALLNIVKSIGAMDKNSK
ncbi:MAG: DUF4328 domain-containing protein [Devosia sp.]